MAHPAGNHNGLPELLFAVLEGVDPFFLFEGKDADAFSLLPIGKDGVDMSVNAVHAWRKVETANTILIHSLCQNSFGVPVEFFGDFVKVREEDEEVLRIKTSGEKVIVTLPGIF